MKSLAFNLLSLLLLGAAFYRTQQSSQIEEKATMIEKRSAELAQEVLAVKAEKEGLTQAVSVQQVEISKLRRENQELSKAQGGGSLSKERRTSSRNSAANERRELTEDPFAKSVMALSVLAAELNQHMQRSPNSDIPELQFLEEGDWITIAKNADLSSEEGVRKALSRVRQKAKTNFAEQATDAMNGFYNSTNGQMPSDPAQLLPYFKSAVDPSLLERYRVIPHGSLPGLPDLGPFLLSEKAPVDRQYDTHFYIGRKGTASYVIGPGSSDPDITWATR